MTIHLHLGAHKTASTHLQAVMRKNAAQLTAAGVHYADPASLRALLGAGQRAAEAMAPLPSLRTTIAKQRLRRLTTGSPGLLIAADENTLGHCAHMVEAGMLYPSARQRLSLWRPISRRRDVICFLAIRDYPEFFSGVHVQSIRDNVFQPLTATAMERLAALPRRWPDLIADIRRTLPRARIVIWRFEDYKPLRAQLADRITGVSGLRAVERKSMQTPSRDAMAALSALASANPDGRIGRGAFEQVLRDHPIASGNPRYAPWSSDQMTAMRATYAEDIAALAADPTVEFLRP